MNVLPHDLSDSDGIGWSPFTAAKRFYSCLLKEAVGGTMIDLSHLTDEEQGMIMTVLRRDAELKKAEDARIRCKSEMFVCFVKINQNVTS